MPSWKKYKFNDFVDINPKVNMLNVHEYDFVEMKDLSTGNRFVLPSDHKHLKGGSRFQNGDTLFARITPCLENGKICQVDGLQNNLGFGSTEFLVFRNKPGISDRDFVFYLSRWDKVRGYAENKMIGTSGRQRVSKDAFNNLEITLPPLPTQHRIAEILGALDDKIELNLQMNKTLEEMAMSLYKHWFVDFGPFKDGEFAESELGPIPKGWEVKRIGDFIQLKYGKALKEVDRILGDYPVYGSSGIVGTHKNSLIDGPALIIGRKGNVGATYWENKPSYPIDTVYYVNSIPLYLLRFIFLLFKNLDFTSRNSDSAVPGLNRNLAHSEKVIVPPDNILKIFENLAGNYYDQIFQNEIENQTLTQTRDYLLPKLISGEIPVN